MSAAILVRISEKIEKTLRVERFLWGSPFKDRLEKVEPIGQLAATGLDRIRLGLTAFDCPADDLVNWYAVLETEYGRYHLLIDTIVRGESVKWYFKRLRIRRSFHKGCSLYLFNPQGRLYGVSRVDTGYTNRHDSLNLSYSIKC